jgi:hypothetical protein
VIEGVMANKFMSNFFTVVDTQGEAMNNIQQNKRVVKKKGPVTHVMYVLTPLKIQS